MKKANEKKHIVRKCFLVIIVTVLLYCIIFFNISYMETNAPVVDSALASSLEASNYYAQQDEVCTDRVMLLGNMTKGLESRLSMIDNASESIELSIFQFGSGDTAKAVVSALTNAASRGVKISLIVDDTSNRLSLDSRYIKALNSYDSVSVYSYGKDSIMNPSTIICSNHDKYMIVDNNLMLLGGRNIEDRFYNEQYDGPLTYDRDILVYGTSSVSVINDVLTYFNQMIQGNGIELKSKDNITESEIEQVKAYEKEFVSEHFLVVDEINYYNVTKSVDKISFVNNGTNSGFKKPNIYYALNSLMENATNEIYIESPYLIMNNAYYSTLNNVTDRGIEFTAVTNSQASSPNILANAAYLDDRDELIDLGLNIYEFQSKNNIHGKAYIIDSEISVVGSYNFDPRSMYLDTEVMLIIDSKTFAHDLEEDIDIYKNQSLLAKSNMSYDSSLTVEEVTPSLFKKCIEKPLTYISKTYKQLA